MGRVQYTTAAAYGLPYQRKERCEVDAKVFIERRRKLESDIVCLLRQFEEESGLVVDDVRINRNYEIGGVFPTVISAEVEARLPR